MPESPTGRGHCRWDAEWGQHSTGCMHDGKWRCQECRLSIDLILKGFHLKGFRLVFYFDWNQNSYKFTPGALVRYGIGFIHSTKLLKLLYGPAKCIITYSEILLIYLWYIFFCCNFHNFNYFNLISITRYRYLKYQFNKTSKYLFHIMFQ